MPKFKSVLAGLAISTALSGGVVALGAVTTATSPREIVVEQFQASDLAAAKVTGEPLGRPEGDILHDSAYVEGEAAGLTGKEVSAL